MSSLAKKTCNHVGPLGRVRVKPSCFLCYHCGSRPISLPSSGSRELGIIESFLSSSSSSEPGSPKFPLVEEEFPGEDLTHLCALHKHEGDFLRAWHRADLPKNPLDDPFPSVCSDHPSQEKNLFCLRCEEFACEDCKTGPVHSKHLILLINESMTTIKQQLLSRIEDMGPKVSAFVEFLPNFGDFSKEVEEARNEQKRSVNDFFGAVISRHPEDEEQCKAIQEDIIKHIKRPAPPTFWVKSTYFGPVPKIDEQFGVLRTFALRVAKFDDPQIFFRGTSMINILLDTLNEPFLRFTPQEHFTKHLDCIKRPMHTLHFFKKAADAKKLPLSLIEEFKRLSPEETLKIIGDSTLKWDEISWAQVQ